MYRIRNQTLNVFGWHKGHDGKIPPAAGASIGYSVIFCPQGGLLCASLPDVDAQNLQQLAALIFAAPYLRPDTHKPSGGSYNPRFVTHRSIRT